VRRFSAFRYVYIRTFDPYGNQKLVDAYHALLAWLAQRGDGQFILDPAVAAAKTGIDM